MSTVYLDEALSNGVHIQATIDGERAEVLASVVIGVSRQVADEFEAADEPLALDEIDYEVRT